MRWASLSLVEMIEDLYMSNTAMLKAMVGNDNEAQFTRYFDGNLWYAVRYVKDEYTDIFEFPVPVSDVGTATFLAKDRSILFMRYIRKHMEMLEKAKAELTDA